MPRDLKDMPRPPSDNGRGLYGSASADWSGGKQGYDYWINELVELGVKWFKLFDDRGNSVPLCEKLLAAGIFPIVRILRRDPPPNDTPEPNPGHIGAPEEKTIRRLIAAGVRYFETNNEPNLNLEWKHNAMPSDQLESAKLVALNWLFDARLILSAGGHPGLPAIGVGSSMDLMGALVALGRQDILLEGCWIAIHNYALNRPLNYPDDPINHSGQLVTAEQYACGPYTDWAWWNNAHGRADTLDEINTLRFNSVNPAQTIQQDHACFREFEYYNALAMKYLGRSIPIISTEGGYRIGRRDDLRYPRVTPEMHCEQTVAMFDWMQRQAPDYYFAATPSLMHESEGWEADAWYSSFWQKTLPNGTDGRDGIPTVAVRNLGVGNHLPVIEAVKAMSNLERRLPGAQPLPPIPAQVQPAPRAAESILGSMAAAVWLRDVPGISVPLIEREEPSVPTQLKSEPELIEEATPVNEEGPVAAPVQPEEENPFAPILPTAPVVEPVEAEPIASTPTPIEPEVYAAPASSEPAPMPFPAFDAPETLAPSPIFESEPLPANDELEWDWRLDALGVAIEPANVSAEHDYWKLVSVVYQGPNESNDNHQIYYRILDERNQPIVYQKVSQGWNGDKTDAVTKEDGTTNIPIWASFAPERGERGPYAAWVDGLPSDRVRGIGLPAKRHVNFVLTWRRARAR